MAIEIETSICLCLSASSLATPWIKLVMAGPPSETSGLVMLYPNNYNFFICLSVL